MATADRILTDEMVAAIKAYFPRYPTRQAVTLPALHIVNERLRCVPLAAVVEMVHMATLVHDDVLDDADTRRKADIDRGVSVAELVQRKYK